MIGREQGRRAGMLGSGQFPSLDAAGVPFRAVLLVFLAAFGYLSLIVFVLRRIGDEGTLLNGAALTAAGAVPYRDFADLANPLSYLWLGAWFSVFGTRFVVARVLLLLTGASAAALIFWLAARAYGVRAGLTAALFATVLGIPCWPGVNHHWDSNLFYLTTLCCLTLWQARGSPVWAFLSGVAAAATAGFMINKGALALVAAAVFVRWVPERNRSRAVLAVAAGFAAAIAAMSAFFLAHGAWPEFVYTNVVFPATEYASTGRVPYAFYYRDLAWLEPLSVLRQILPAPAAAIAAGVLGVPLTVVAVVPLVAALLLARRYVGGNSYFDSRETLLWIGGAALWVSEAHRWDLYHLLYGSPVMLAAVIGELLAGGAGRKWESRLVASLTVCGLALGSWQGALHMAARDRQETRRGSARVYAPDPALQFLLDKTKPGEPVFVYPYNPMYYFLADVRNPTRYGILLYGYNTPVQFREAVADLERAKPRFVLWDTVIDGGNWKRWYPTYVPPKEEDLIVEPYLSGHYRTTALLGGFRVMERTE